MKLKLFSIAITLFFSSCGNDTGRSEIPRKVSTLKSDVLMQSLTNGPFARPHSHDQLSLTLSGPSILEATATFKVVNKKGEEIHCETFPSIELIQPDYRTANSVLQEAHIRDVVKGYFIDDQIPGPGWSRPYAGM